MFKSKISNLESFNPNEKRDDRILLFKMMIKCADVSNPTKEMSIYDGWTRLITQEFMAQGDRERGLGLPISPYMDRENVNVPSCQVGFIDYVVSPLFDAFDKYIAIPNIKKRMASNREYWGDLKNAGVTLFSKDDDPMAGIDGASRQMSRKA